MKCDKNLDGHSILNIRNYIKLVSVASVTIRGMYRKDQGNFLYCNDVMKKFGLEFR